MHEECLKEVQESNTSGYLVGGEMPGDWAEVPGRLLTLFFYVLLRITRTYYLFKNLGTPGSMKVIILPYIWEGRTIPNEPEWDSLTPLRGSLDLSTFFFFFCYGNFQLLHLHFYAQDIFTFSQFLLEVSFLGCAFLFLLCTLTS